MKKKSLPSGFIPNIDCYLVGGAVRDRLLGISSHDRDWLVTGQSVQDMLDLGFEIVGQDFPVFLHPISKEEYALARTEKKTGQGYGGFTFHTSSEVSVEDDLVRRDLTINAIAENAQGELIDPFNGCSDISNRLLRHVSDAFTEDPLRVLRVARFQSQFAHLGFSIAKETMVLMEEISSSGELRTLSAERIWQETCKALLSQSPQAYFKTLYDCKALSVLFPEVDALFGIEQRADYHPEIDCGIHTLLCLEQAQKLCNSKTSQLDRSDIISIMFSTLTHDLGKALTPNDVLPSHKQHETRGLPLVKQLSKRLKVPKSTLALALLCCEYHLHSHRAFELRPQTILKLFKALDLYRQGDRLGRFLIVCEADSKGRTGFENRAYPQTDYLKACFDASSICKASDLSPDVLKLGGKIIGEQIDQLRYEAITKVHQLRDDFKPCV